MYKRYDDANFAFFREIIKFSRIFSPKFGTLTFIAYLYCTIGCSDCNTHVALTR